MEDYFGDDIITRKDIRTALNEAIEDGYYDIAEDIENILQFTSDYPEDGFILDSYFSEYMEQESISRGDVSEAMAYYVDWDKFAEAVQMDYASIDFGLLTYWVRK